MMNKMFINFGGRKEKLSEMKQNNSKRKEGKEWII